MTIWSCLFVPIIPYCQHWLVFQAGVQGFQAGVIHKHIRDWNWDRRVVILAFLMDSRGHQNGRMPSLVEHLPHQEPWRASMGSCPALKRHLRALHVHFCFAKNRRHAKGHATEDECGLLGLPKVSGAGRKAVARVMEQEWWGKDSGIWLQQMGAKDVLRCPQVWFPGYLLPLASRYATVYALLNHNYTSCL